MTPNDTPSDLTREAERLASLLPDVDGQVILSAIDMTDHQRKEPQWLWHDTESGHIQYGRWPRKPGTPYVRLDLGLASLLALSARLTASDAEVARLTEERDAARKAFADAAALVGRQAAIHESIAATHFPEERRVEHSFIAVQFRDVEAALRALAPAPTDGGAA